MAIEWLDIDSSKFGYSGEPFVTVSTKKTSKRLYINSCASKKANFEDIEFVRVGIDAERKIMALQKVDEDGKGIIKVHNGGGEDNVSKTVAINNLINIAKELSGQEPNTTIRYACDYDENLNALIVDFKEEK